jgi:hypothetical protein
MGKDAPVSGSNLSSPQKSTGQTLRPERRRVARIDPGRVLRCRVVPTVPGPAPRAALLDISEHGAALLVSRRLAAKSRFSLQLAKRRGYPCSVLAARVVYCLDADSGRWVLGCEFDTPMTDGALADLLA